MKAEPRYPIRPWFGVVIVNAPETDKVAPLDVVEVVVLFFALVTTTRSLPESEVVVVAIE